MRDAFSESLIAHAKADDRIVLLTGDHGYALFDDFRKECPNSYINAGIAEQNMVGVAAGLAKSGFIPFVYGLAAFVPIRVLEQIKIDICYEGLPVILCGDGAGVVYSTLGTSHQSTEDISALRAVPNISILSPSDYWEMRACMDLAVKANGPVYLRMGKSDIGHIHQGPLSVAVGEMIPIKAGLSIGFIATGSMVKTALEVSRHFPGASVWSAPSIKPLDIETVIGICKRHGIVVVLEEHSIYGGLGSAVAEISTRYFPTRVCRIGIRDRFSKDCGTYQYLIEEHQLDKQSVIDEVNDFIAICESEVCGS